MNTDIIETIRYEIQQLQLPLIERIETLEKELYVSTDGLCVTSTLLSVSLINIPVSCCRQTAEQLEKRIYELPENKKTQAVIHGLANWMELFQGQADALDNELEARRKLHHVDYTE